MRSDRLRLGLLPALTALTLLVHPPAIARTLMLRSALCGAGGAIDIPLQRAPGRSRDERPCSAACHAASTARKRSVPGRPAF